jgi:hypothetical protein
MAPGIVKHPYQGIAPGISAAYVNDVTRTSELETDDTMLVSSKYL